MKTISILITSFFFINNFFIGSLYTNVQKTLIFQCFFDVQESKIDSLIKPILSNFKYPIGIGFLGLNTNEEFYLNRDEEFPTASAVKIEILIHVMREFEKGNLNLYENIPVNLRVGGSGLLQYFDQTELKLSYYNLALLMIHLSDNTATNILIDKLGMENINRTIQEIGLTQTKLQRVMMDFELRKSGRENLSTPGDKVKLLRMIYDQTILSDTLNNEVIKILSLRKLTPLLEGIEDEITLASKGGELEDVRCEMGIFFCEKFNYILVVMTKDLPNSKYGDEVIGKISKSIYDYMKSKYSK